MPLIEWKAIMKWFIAACSGVRTLWTTTYYYEYDCVIWARRQMALLLLIAFILIRGVRFFSSFFPFACHLCHFYVVSFSMEDRSFDVPRRSPMYLSCRFIWWRCNFFRYENTHSTFRIISTFFLFRINLCIVHANWIVLLLKWIEKWWHSFLIFLSVFRSLQPNSNIHFGIVHCL